MTKLTLEPVFKATGSTSTKSPYIGPLEVTHTWARWEECLIFMPTMGF